MKLSKFSLGISLAVITVSSMIVSSASEASSLLFNDGPGSKPLTLSSLSFQFEFLSNNGDYRSNLFVGNAHKALSINQVLFKETKFDDNSEIKPHSRVDSTEWARFPGDESKWLLGWWSDSISSDGVITSVPSVYSVDEISGKEPAPPVEDQFVQFKYLSSDDAGWYTYGIEETKRAVNPDYNDATFRVRAVPVPVPAIVPGVALAAVFFGGKALKRKQKAKDKLL